MKRVLFDIFLILGLFLLPWWVGFILAFIGIFLFKNFYEFIFFGILIYIIYGFDGYRLLFQEFWIAVILVLIFFILSRIKRSLIF